MTKDVIKNLPNRAIINSKYYTIFKNRFHFTPRKLNNHFLIGQRYTVKNMWRQLDISLDTKTLIKNEKIEKTKETLKTVNEKNLHCFENENFFKSWSISQNEKTYANTQAFI